jgi:hypothetical protein
MLSSTRVALIEDILRENGPYPIGYQPPSKLGMVGGAISTIIVILVFGWIVLGIIQAPIPDYLVHPLIDTFTDPLAHLAAFLGGY